MEKSAELVIIFVNGWYWVGYIAGYDDSGSPIYKINYDIINGFNSFSDAIMAYVDLVKSKQLNQQSES